MDNPKGRLGNDGNESQSKPSNQRKSVEVSKPQIKGLRLDVWQEEVLEYPGNIALRAGRQVGKSTVIAIKAGEEAIQNRDTSIMIVSATERQAYLLFSKVLMYLDDNYRNQIKRGRYRPTKTEIKLTNGSIIRCLPTGLDGLGIRGYTINTLIADEAAFVSQDVWPAITPALATTGGKIILLSTPMGKQGYFYDRSTDEDFKTWHINALKIAEERDEPQRTWMRNFQEKERERMTRLQFQQEYEGLFVDELRQFFSDSIIRDNCTLKRTQTDPKGEYYLGVDCARMGEDASTFQIIQKLDKHTFKHIESIATYKTLTTDTFDTIMSLDRQYNFRKIGIDAGSGSLGVGILDFLIREPQVRKKMVALDNKKRDLDSRGEQKKTLQKADMYLNMLAMLEKGKLRLLDDDDLTESMKAIQYEYFMRNNQISSMRLFAPKHKYTDLIEGLVRATWLANQKHINTMIHYV